MIHITYDRDPAFLRLTLTGHAGYAAPGGDIVCAACTILAYALAQSVAEEEENGNLAEPATIIMESGDITIEASPQPYSEGLIMRMYDMIINAYRLIENSYAQYVRITTVGSD